MGSGPQQDGSLEKRLITLERRTLANERLVRDIRRQATQAWQSLWGTSEQISSVSPGGPQTCEAMFSGYVVDETGAPIPGANVDVFGQVGPAISVTTESDGFFEGTIIILDTGQDVDFKLSAGPGFFVVTYLKTLHCGFNDVGNLHMTHSGVCVATDYIFGICNHNSQLDDDWEVYLNNTYVGTYDGNHTTCFGNFFRTNPGIPPSLVYTGTTLGNPNHICCSSGVVPSPIDKTLFHSGSNLIKLKRLTVRAGVLSNFFSLIVDTIRDNHNGTFTICGVALQQAVAPFGGIPIGGFYTIDFVL